MTRDEVYDVINSERDYQESNKPNPVSHIVEEFPLSSALEAIRYNINKANSEWYNTQEPYTEAMHYIRKVAAICTQMGEKYGMPSRYDKTTTLLGEPPKTSNTKLLREGEAPPNFED